jgi:hypothetical protein
MKSNVQSKSAHLSNLATFCPTLLTFRGRIHDHTKAKEYFDDAEPYPERLAEC